MAIDYWIFPAIISRFIVCIFCILLMLFFQNKYKISKKDGGTPNSYFTGLTWYFGVLGIILLLVGIEEILTVFGIFSIDLKTDFPGFDASATANTYGLLSKLSSNLLYPVFLMLLIICLVVFMIQIYPLEQILQRKKVIFWVLFSAVCANALIYIPFTLGTIYPYIAIFYGYFRNFSCVFLLNFYLTAVIIKQSAGEVRKRAIMNITGFFLFLFGLIW